MKVKLIRILKEQDNNGSTKELARYFKDVELLIKPQQNMRIQVDNIEFFIEIVEQDLNTQTVILYEYIDIFYRHNWGDVGFKKERNLLSEAGCKLL